MSRMKIKQINPLLSIIVFALVLSFFLSTTACAQQESNVVAKGIVRSIICLLLMFMPAVLAIMLIIGGALFLLGGLDKRTTGKKIIRNSIYSFLIFVLLVFAVSVAIPDIDVQSCYRGSLFENHAPIAEARGGYQIEVMEKKVEVSVGDVVYFDGSMSKDVDGEIAVYSWSFDDGATSTGKTTQHVYESEGEYIVELSVVDDKGLESPVKSRVKVIVNPRLRVEKSVSLIGFTKPSTASSINGDYIVRDEKISVSFSANAFYGTPCPGPEYYSYLWQLDGKKISDRKEFTRNSMEFEAGKHNLSLVARDCRGREAKVNSTLYVVEKLNASIINITSGGEETYEVTCSSIACNFSACSPIGEKNATDTYIGNRVYVYNRTMTLAGGLLELTYDGSLIYDVVEPEVEVFFPNRCGDCKPHGFYTIVRENSTKNYYVLIGEDDFIGGLENVVGGICKEVCKAFIDDFIPFVSEILQCGYDRLEGPTRVGTTSNGYTRVIAIGGKTNVTFIFADDMSVFFNEKNWKYRTIETSSGVSSLTIHQLCFLSNKTRYVTERCPLNFSAKVSGGLPPYKVKWVSSGDGVIDRGILKRDGGVYELITTPPLSPPLSPGIHDLEFIAVDQLGLESRDTYLRAEIPSCCAIGTPCHTHWPGREGPLVLTGNEVSYSCDIYEVCRPELWERVREAVYCCKTNCTGTITREKDGVCNREIDGECDLDCKSNEDLDCVGYKCHKECSQATAFSRNFLQEDGTFSYEGLKKCSALYLIEGFGPAARYMTDYFWAEICAAGYSYCLKGCCRQDLGTCSCCWHAYNREVFSLPVYPAAVSFSSRGWASDVAMNKNTCFFADLPAYASMEVINTGTCCDYSNALTTTLRILGFTRDEVYSVNGPGHCYNMVKLPGDPKFTLVDTTGNKKVPYVPRGIPPGGYPYCSFEGGSCRNDAGQVICPGNVYC